MRYIQTLATICNALVIEEDDKELYTYGFFILLSHLFYLAIAILLGVLLGILTENLLFYIFFMLLRNYAGGFHAKSERVCTLLTILACLSVLCCTVLRGIFISSAISASVISKK